MEGRAHIAAGALVASLLLVSCAAGGDDLPQARPGESTPHETPEGSQSPTFVNGGVCQPTRDRDLPAKAGCVTSVTAEAETLSVYARVTGRGRPLSWRLRLSSDGVITDRSLDAGTDFSYPRAIGASDVDRDGRTEWWVKVADYTSHGAPWSGLNLFVRDGARLVPLSIGGEPVVISFGGIARMGEGAECRKGRLVLLRAEATNRRNTRWAISERTFVLRGSRARLIDRQESSLVIDGYNDPELDRYHQVECYGMTFTPFG